MANKLTANEVMKLIKELDADEMDRLVGFIGQRILIANWFGKETLSSLLNKELDDADYQKYLDEWNWNGCWDDISDTIRAWCKSIEIE